MPANVAEATMVLLLQNPITIALDPDEVARISTGVGMWVGLVRDLGILATACGFFIWSGWLREKEHLSRIKELDGFIQTHLLKCVMDSTEVMAKLSAALSEHTDAIKKMADCTEEACAVSKTIAEIVRSRPCLMDATIVERLQSAIREQDKR